MGEPSYGSVAAVAAKVSSALAAASIASPVGLGKYLLKQKRDPLVGQVVIIPTHFRLAAPRIDGPSNNIAGGARATFAVDQNLEIHCWMGAAKQSDPSTQYAADLTVAELLRNAVLRALEIYIPSAKRGGDGAISDVGENVFGVEIVANVSIVIDALDIPFLLADPATTKTISASLINTLGDPNPDHWLRDSGSDQYP